MKKTLLSVAFICAVTTSMNAQTVFEENFNGITTWPDVNWKQYNIDGKTPDPAMGAVVTAFTQPGSPWGLISFTNNPTNLFVASTSWFTVPGQANRWLVSPSIDLSSYSTGTVELTFKTQSGGQAPYLDGYSLYVSTTGTAVADFGTTAAHQETAATEGVWTTQTVDLSTHLGQKIHLGWQHTGNDGVYLLLDDIKVVYTGSSSSEQFFTENFTLYPNPTTDVLNIESKNGLVAGEIRITDMTGKVVNVQKDATTVNVSNLASGTYLIDITTNEGKASSKFIKK